MGWSDCKWKWEGGQCELGLQPGGDLISEISLSLTKLGVKQSLVGESWWKVFLGWGEGGQEGGGHTYRG